jgi:hypothetical protein
MPDNQEADRELVQQMLSREWDELTVAVHIRQFDPRFRVPGRLADGSPRSQYRMRRYVGLIGKTLHLVVVLAAELLSSATGLGAPRSPRSAGRYEVPRVRRRSSSRRRFTAANSGWRYPRRGWLP